jgi:hypothetical protein
MGRSGARAERSYALETHSCAAEGRVMAYGGKTPALRVRAGREVVVRPARAYFPISPICAIVSPFFSDGTAPM